VEPWQKAECLRQYPGAGQVKPVAAKRAGPKPSVKAVAAKPEPAKPRNDRKAGPHLPPSIKGTDARTRVRCAFGGRMPAVDRHWAVAHEAAQLEPGWNRCVNFARAAKARS